MATRASQGFICSGGGPCPWSFAVARDSKHQNAAKVLRPSPAAASAATFAATALDPASDRRKCSRSWGRTRRGKDRPKQNSSGVTEGATAMVLAKGSVLTTPRDQGRCSRDRHLDLCNIIVTPVAQTQTARTMTTVAAAAAAATAAATAGCKSQRAPRDKMSSKAPPIAVSSSSSSSYAYEARFLQRSAVPLRVCVRVSKNGDDDGAAYRKPAPPARRTDGCMRDTADRPLLGEPPRRHCWLIWQNTVSIDHGNELGNL